MSGDERGPTLAIGVVVGCSTLVMGFMAALMAGEVVGVVLLLAPLVAGLLVMVKPHLRRFGAGLLVAVAVSTLLFGTCVALVASSID